ncbi:G patch domain-containing protein 4 [Cyclopterus lumpus]|uniref:G patch domain-containing protein 4 n=1 Tax=Cyclopterus lumpus TaxID=8103 RepID=A0A8C2ZCA5_CYCLU|nr:G patch domain-containing protein 4 [Cyclopterus lumpus]
MAEVVPEKSRGLKFAEQQLLRHGWEHGKGLGRGEDGISEAIKIKVKCDKGGIGHKEGDQFTFHWWDHVFNKASSSLQVESDQNGIQLKKTVEEEEEDGLVSNKKPRKAALAKAKLYGCFVKSTTLLSGQKQPEATASSSDSSSSDEDDEKLDLSSATKLSDADLIKACGGRTAHKGARHGLTMSAKLARLEQQEAEFMAKYEKKSQPAPPTSQSADQRAEGQEEAVRDSRSRRMESSGGVIQLTGDEESVSPETDVKPKKKKKKKKKASEDTEEITDLVSTDEDIICVENREADQSHKSKRKLKKKKPDSEDRTPSPAAETVGLHTQVKRKRRKPSRTHTEPAEEEEEEEEEEEGNGTESNEKEAEVTEEEAAVKPKRKKCKKDKYDEANEETLPPKKKKKKKKSKE